MWMILLANVFQEVKCRGTADCTATAWLMRPIAAPRMGHIGHKFEAPGDRGGRAVRAARLSDPRRATVAGAAWPTGAVGTFWAHLGTNQSNPSELHQMLFRRSQPFQRPDLRQVEGSNPSARTDSVAAFSQLDGKFPCLLATSLAASWPHFGHTFE
jgi:hypothetical protein